jgi:hypothetical protein
MDLSPVDVDYRGRSISLLGLSASSYKPVMSKLTQIFRPVVYYSLKE